LVYFAPNNANGLLEAVRKAISDNRADVISITWGRPESDWPEHDADVFNQLFKTAQIHCTICVASGDLGAIDGAKTGALTADFPAASQFVLACGGTRFPRGDTEVAWRGSGGGFSRFSVLKRPDYQNGVNFNKGRGEPDVAANADVATGYRIRVNGKDVVLGGTSAAAPLWAALVALINQKLGANVGFVNPDLYRAAQDPATNPFTDIVSGTNDGYAATSGWDPVTGWGSPIGTKVLAALKRAVSSSVPIS
jgi:kumamolisin